MTTAAAPDYFAEPERIASTRRAQQIARLAAYYDGSQYDGRPDFFTGLDAGGKVVPIRERKPCIVYPLPKAACNQAARFTFGEGRFPVVAVAEAESEDATTALDADQAKLLTTYLAHVIELARLKSAMRRLLRIGLSQRSAVAVLSVRRGRFSLDMPRPQDCWVRFVDDDPEGDVAQMVWCYQFEKAVKRGDVVTTETHYFRRDFNDTEVVFYEDAPFVPGKAVEWVRDEKRTKPHKLGFCPVVWTRNLPADDCADVDGLALYEDLEDEFDAMNLALSQRHRGIVYFGTPQAYEVGVSQDEQPGAIARTERPAKASTDPAAKRDGYTKSGGGAARKRAPDEIWSYQSPDALPGIIETTGIAFDVSTKHVLDVRARILEAIDVVLLDPMTVAGKGELSAKALAMMYAPLLALVDELRDCWWSTGLARILSMILRITVALGGRGILVPQAAAVANACAPFLVAFEGETLWVPPKMVPSWGSYFSPTNAEIGELVTATVSAKDAGLIGAETAKRNVASAFGETDLDEDDDDDGAPRRSSPTPEGQMHGMNPLHMEVCDDARRLALPAAFLATLGRSKVGQLGEYSVWTVDGAAVRGFDVCFSDSANPSFYTYVSAGELWIERRIAENTADLVATALHEAIECEIGAEGTIGHEAADGAAHGVEELVRRMLQVLPAPTGPAGALALAASWLPGLVSAAKACAAACETAEGPPSSPAPPGAPQGAGKAPITRSPAQGTKQPAPPAKE
jgi:hypothetical protein